MEEAHRIPFAERFNRFLRWFFTASPLDLGTHPTAPHLRTQGVARGPVVRRRATPHSKPRHDGPVRVASRIES